jgi:hypothetical protein
LFFRQSAGVNFDAVFFRPQVSQLKEITGFFRCGVFVEINDRSEEIGGCFTCPLKRFLGGGPMGSNAWHGMQAKM